jgi:hypothetical protein
MGGLSVEVKLCRGDCSLVVSSEKFASPFMLAIEQTCASIEHYIFASPRNSLDFLLVDVPAPLSSVPGEQASRCCSCNAHNSA